MKVGAGLYFFFGFLCILVGGYTVKLFSRAPAAVPVVLFSIDERFSESEQQAITLFLEDKRSTLSQPTAVSLKNKFPEIVSIALEYAGVVDCLVEVKGAHPLVCVNGTQLLCDQGALVPTAIYHADVVKKVPIVTVDEGVRDAVFIQQFRTFVQKITPALHDRFSITWHGSTHIVLQDKVKSDHAIVVDETVLPSEKYLAYCDKAYACMKELCKKNIPIVTDIRFEKQIITYCKREGSHGQHFV